MIPTLGLINSEIGGGSERERERLEREREKLERECERD